MLDARGVVGSTETAVGLVVTNGFTAVLPRTAGRVVAKDIIMLGEPFDAAQATIWGLVDRAVPDADLDTALQGVVGTLRTKSPNALRLAKRLLDQGWGAALEDAMRREATASVETAQSDDAHEAAVAFTAGRAPRFALS